MCHAFEERYKLYVYAEYSFDHDHRSQASLHSEYRRAILDAKRNMASSSRHLLRDKRDEAHNEELEVTSPSRPANASMA